jgi:dihydropyrimidine dehydrogenase (NAD+) subunit PreT
LDSTTIAALIAGGLILSLAVYHLLRRRAMERRARHDLDKLIAERRHLPPSLHPVIDPEICIGSLACLKACPEGDILGIIDGKARLIHAEHCIGHGKCAAECPVGAISLVMGTAERGIDLPEVDEFFESSRPGVHVVGELGGMGLIKNAIVQGQQCADRLAGELKTPAPEGVVDVVIVGAGPAGLAAAAALREKGKTFRVLEQQAFGGTIAQYPRQKVVMTEEVDVPFIGKIGKKEISKEDLLEQWDKLVKKARIQVEEGIKVTTLEGNDGAFTVGTDKGTVNARKVVLATGRRGSPRKLGCPGENLSKVTYKLDDPEQYNGCSVLVVGGGDSAVEAAVQLSKESDARVAISYRGPEFNRCRDANKKRITEAAAKNALTIHFNTEVASITDKTITLKGKGAATLENDFVIVLAGGELPVQFLQVMGVELRRYHGEKLGANKKKTPQQSRAGLAKQLQVDNARRLRNLIYLATGVLILVWLYWHGRNYYPLDAHARLKSPEHPWLKSSGPFGHWVGIAATLVMLSNFIYPVRKRLQVLKGVGHIRDWLDFHVFVGFCSPAVIAFHAAFQSKNQLATATAASLLVVVLTGIIGRFIYALVPSEKGRVLERADVLGLLERAKDRLIPLADEAEDPKALEDVLHFLGRPIEPGGIADFLSTVPAEWFKLRSLLRAARRSFGHGEQWSDVKELSVRIGTLRTQARFFGGLKRLLAGWRVFHATLAVFLVVAMTAHIGVSLYLGYIPWKQ